MDTHGKPSPNETAGEAAAETAAFLRAVYSAKQPDHHLLIWTLPSRRSCWLTEVPDAIACAADKGDDCEVYCGVGLCAKDLGRGRRTTDSNVAALVGFVADLDFRSDETPKKRAAPPDEQSAMRVLDDCGLTPTVIVHSGHGLQSWWFLPEPEALATRERRDAVPSLSAAWSRSNLLKPVMPALRLRREAGWSSLQTAQDYVDVAVEEDERRSRATWAFEHLEQVGRARELLCCPASDLRQGTA